MEQAKKDCILLEAARAFARFGFKKTSIDDVAKAAGVAKGTVYLACESKEDLFYQVLHREIRSWAAETAKLIDPRVRADELLSLMSEHGIAYLDARPLVRDLLFGRLDQTFSQSDRLDALRRIGTSNIVEVLRLGIDQKIFRPKLDVDTIASLMLDLQVSAYLFHAGPVDGRDDRLRGRSKVAIDLLLHGLTSPS
jgi:AcrR family transcriptional regulator